MHLSAADSKLLLTACDDMHANLYDVRGGAHIDAFSGATGACGVVLGCRCATAEQLAAQLMGHAQLLVLAVLPAKLWGSPTVRSHSLTFLHLCSPTSCCTLQGTSRGCWTLPCTLTVAFLQRAAAMQRRAWHRQHAQR